MTEFLECFLADVGGTEVLAEVAAEWRDRRAAAIAEVAGPETTTLRMVAS